MKDMLRQKSKDDSDLFADSACVVYTTLQNSQNMFTLVGDRESIRALYKVPARTSEI
jgi:hypothetical protein